jgi:hypothetical protein
MRSFARTLATAAALLAACSSSSSSPQASGTVTITSTSDSLSADSASSLSLTISAVDGSGNPATGSVHVYAVAGRVDGKPSEDVSLASGSATVKFTCDASLISACKATTATVGAVWNGTGGSITLALSHITIVPDAGTPDAGTPDAGGTTDAGTADSGPTTAPINAKIVVGSVNPPNIFSQDAAAVGLPISAVITFGVNLVTGEPLAGAEVTFSPTIGEDLVVLSSSSTVTDINGICSVQVTAKSAPGVAHINANAAGVAVVIASVPIVGPPASIVEVSAAPSVLGLKGSGIQEHGLMTFLVSDAYGSPVPNAQIDFSQSQPALIGFNNTTGRSDGAGIVSVGYSSGLEVGVTSISATFHSNAAIRGSHQVAVRGARPSASGFYFKCDHGNLPVYNTVTRLATMTCHVRLSDRFGNRVGIPTPVNFATEAGAISASAVTKGFSFDNPTDPLEGTVDVTFTTDMGNGLGPADVDPLPASTSTYPSPRAAEPFHNQGSLVYNPRDQLVTLIAWTQGEEAFVDSNHNGKYDTGELFVDEGDPFIDANDDNVWDRVVPNGQWEPYFCASVDATGICPAYQGPNGQWDSLTTIWVPTWVVFGGSMQPTDTPSFGSAQATQFSPPCAEFGSAPFKSGHSSIITAPVYVYDNWFNTPPAGYTYQAAYIDSITAIPLSQRGFVAEPENFGAMGALGVDFDYRAVSAKTGTACTIDNGPACVLNLSFYDFDDGYRGTLVFQNTLATGAADAFVYGCPTADPGAPVPRQFTMYVQALPQGQQTGPRGFFTGTYAITK